MVDSSYTVPCNPNTMRDNGPCRNAIYNLSDKAELDYMRKSQQSFGKTIDSFAQAPIKAHDIERMRDTLNSRCTHMRPQSAFG